MTLAERRARRFAELWGSEARHIGRVTPSDGWWYVRTFDGNVVFGDDVELTCPDERMGSRFVLRFADTLRQVLDELPDEWTEEELAEAEARASEMMGRGLIGNESG